MPHPGGGWQVIGSNSRRAAKRTATMAKAIEIGRVIASNQKADLYICVHDNNYGLVS